MTWLETLTSAPVVVAGLIGISATLFVGRRGTNQTKEQVKDIAHSAQADTAKAKMAQTVGPDEAKVHC